MVMMANLRKIYDRVKKKSSLKELFFILKIIVLSIKCEALHGNNC